MTLCILIVIKSTNVFRSDNIFAISSKINKDLMQLGYVRTDEFAFIDSLNYNEFIESINALNFNNTSRVILVKDLHSFK